MPRLANLRRIGDFDPAPILGVFRAIDEIFDNADCLLEDRALDAARAGRAAYASTSTYHNQVATSFGYDANERGLIYAIGRWADDSRAGTHTIRLRGSLVPLNAQAVAELAEFDLARVPEAA